MHVTLSKTDVGPLPRDSWVVLIPMRASINIGLCACQIKRLRTYDLTMSKVIIEEIEFLSGYEDEDASSPWEPTENKQTDMESQVTHSKGLAKVVAVAAILFLVLCVGLVGVSLRMSEDIDSKVRNSNEMLQRYNEQMSDQETASFMNTTTPS
ncbi:hypothetical protein DPMN_078216 [Dreissena polymorpha]|uniref:Uncharacterized protein n=2 Tax=Dreissena polymorpha TaxID=45954 RepID=A0A9D4BHA9_DREPO|nr:hypothetical protein DPMN_078216 [Dreissena polymorpha]